MDFKKLGFLISMRMRMLSDLEAARRVASLVDGLARIPRACVLIDSILVIKTEGPAGTNITVRTLSEAEVEILQENPEIQADPDNVLDKLAVAIARR
ncbi:hypothetical protein OWR29_26350 [Actinoplanes sp. Pm04-4]|uniref:Uncharacterized protein n=1 Tax=Paractinoplanes pyxinae TaxID=2997416 RepID=A0ABT4B4V2_9ACTN|nr:hypothetical protein [Actinoplanes pyxinae]MCY1141534.1 hypothetical protein [Actinoplanes pyxinae]